MLDLAKHIIEKMTGKFEPEQFEDRYENALIELIRSKQKGMPIKPQPTHRQTNVINLMDALRRSVEGEKGEAGARTGEKGLDQVAGQPAQGEGTQGRLMPDAMPSEAALRDYHQKRNFTRTKPPGKLKRRTGDLFVVQKHAARRLHYDLRLELDGVLKSWAVTKGPSLSPEDKRLRPARQGKLATDQGG